MSCRGLYTEAVQLFIELTLQLCFKVPSVMENDDSFYKIARRLNELVANDTHELQLSSKSETQLSRLLSTCWELLPEEQQRREQDATGGNMNQYRVHVRSPLRAASSATTSSDGFARGPRHDNDTPNYKRIMTFPTELEMRTREDPHLPLYPGNDGEFSHVLDFHFRSLREDLFAKLKRGLQWFLGGEGLWQYYHQNKKLVPPRSQDVPSLFVCNQVRLETLSCHYRKGVSLEVSAAQPLEQNVAEPAGPEHQWSQAEMHARAEREEYWSRDRLTVGSLIALAVGIKANEFPRDGAKMQQDEAEEYPRRLNWNCRCVYFGTVSVRNKHRLIESPKRFTIGLKVAHTDLAAVLNALHEPGGDCLLVETSGLCFAPTRAVLKTLKRIDNEHPPLLDELFAVNEERFLSTPRFEADIEPWDLEDSLWGNPRNLQRDQIDHWNLQHLLKEEFRRREELSSVPVNSFEELCERLKAYEQHGMLLLDGSQVEAFAAALTRSSCLIQGPPGTGKSYIGTKIVETLLKQSCWRQRAPIVCVCYTNHALDQFLEALVASGACASYDIVRMGRRSKSESMQQRSIGELQFNQASTRQEHQAIGHIVSMCKEMEEGITQRRFGDADMDLHGFFDWFQDHFPHQHHAIVEQPHEDAEGFRHHDSVGKSRSERWNSWCRGKKLARLDDASPPQLHTTGDVARRFPTENEETSAKRLLRACTSNMWDLDRQDRQLLERYWRRQYQDDAISDLSCEIMEYESNVQAFQDVVSAQSLRILRQAKLVGITTTGCAQNQELIRALDPKIVMCEEAGEVLEAHLLACITSGTQQLIQIGDHLQLRPSVNEYKLSVESRQGVNLDISLFERMVTARERFFNKNTALMHQHGALVTLQTQRRMRSTIADLVRYTLYPSLEDASDVLGYPDLRGFRDNVWFLDHNHFESADEVSYSNAFEAEFIVELIQYAVKQGYGVKEEAGADDIAVLTPYLGQLRLIRSLLEDRRLRVKMDERDEELLQQLGEPQDQEEPAKSSVRQLGRMVKLSTVDNFQGNEATLVLISTVRCNESGRSGFLKTFNRVNVMLSRAKHGMIVLGSSSTIRKEGRAEMFLRVLDLLESRQMVGSDLVLKCHNHGTETHVATAQELMTKAGDGGCSLPCQARLSCGHVCSRMCHPDDSDHSMAVCFAPCNRLFTECGHWCTRVCHAKCSCDAILPEYQRSCLHRLKNVRCSTLRNRLKAPCDQPERMRMPVCGHEVLLECWMVRESAGCHLEDWDLNKLIDFSAFCNHECSGLRKECEHRCKKACGQCLQAAISHTPPTSIEELVALTTQPREVHHGACEHACGRALVCGHDCQGVCHRPGQCAPCQRPCENTCAHSQCTKKCNEPCASCSEPCQWVCQHMKQTCPLPCGSACIRLPCDKRCELHLECGHQCPGLCGERCLPSAYCRECGDQATHSDDVVDMLTLTQLKDHDPDDSPLIKLRCGHAFTIETLDHLMKIDDFYDRVDGTNEWKCAKPLQRSDMNGLGSTLGCPSCRAPVIGGIQRYGRVLHFGQTRTSELKFRQKVNALVAKWSEQRHKLLQAFTEAEDVSRRTGVLSDALALSADSLQSLQLVSPTHEVMMKEACWLGRLGLEDQNLNLAAYSEVTAKYSCLQLRLEHVQVVALTFQLQASLRRWELDQICESEPLGPRGELTKRLLVQLQQRFDEAVQVEEDLLQLCEETRSHESRWKALITGVHLRACYHLALRGLDGARGCAGGADSFASSKYQLAAKYEQLRLDHAFQQPAHAAKVAELQNLMERCLRPGVLHGSVSITEKRAILRAFGSTDATRGAFGGFGGRWYECPNGHPYVVTECGGAMQVSTCPECHAPIGGQLHGILEDNRDATQFFEGTLT